MPVEAHADPGLPAEALVVAQRFDAMVERIEQPGLEPPLRQEAPGRAQVEQRIAAEDDAGVGARADVEQRSTDAPGAGRVVGG